MSIFGALFILILNNLKEPIFCNIGKYADIALMTSVITGDIINSRKSDQKSWLLPFKKMLSQYGKSPKVWEISRGDAFQVEIKESEKSLLIAITIKALIKSLGTKELDVRMAIGIGDKTYDANRISESAGSAFINSGGKFDSLKKIKQNMAVKTSWIEVDTEINLMIKLALTFMDKWSASSAEIVFVLLNELFKSDKMLSQKELEKKLKLKQSSISERQTRAHSEEIMELVQFYRTQISQKM